MKKPTSARATPKRMQPPKGLRARTDSAGRYEFLTKESGRARASHRDDSRMPQKKPVRRASLWMRMVKGLTQTNSALEFLAALKYTKTSPPICLRGNGA